MYDISDELNLTKELTVDNLIQVTIDCVYPMWECTEYTTFNQYIFKSKITDKSNICFKIYNYKDYDSYILSVYMTRDDGKKIINLFTVDGYIVGELVKEIELSNYMKTEYGTED